MQQSGGVAEMVEAAVGAEGIVSLRPGRLGDYIGQRKVVENLGVFLRAAVRRQEALDHVLLYGPPGLGKTTLATIISHEMQTELKTVSGPAVQRAGDLAAILTNLKEGEVLFIDEIHRLNPAIEEILYPAMEDFQLDLIIGQGPAARTVKIELPRFTLVGATTRASLISAPLRGRFGILHHLDFYPEGELEAIVRRSAQLLAVEVEAAAVTEIARRARGTPRIANMLIRRVRDFAQVIGSGAITEGLAAEALDRMEVDAYGLNELDRKILVAIIEKFDGGPVGLGTIAASTAEDKGAIEELYEPYLIQRGLLNRTPRGRVVTRAAYIHLGIKPPVRDAA